MTFTRTISGKQYLYRSVREGNKVKSIYVGKPSRFNSFISFLSKLKGGAK